MKPNRTTVFSRISTDPLIRVQIKNCRARWDLDQQPSQCVQCVFMCVCVSQLSGGISVFQVSGETLDSLTSDL